MLKLSIVIPCYNEAGNIYSLLNKLESIQSKEIEVILVDNGSTDNTSDILDSKLNNEQLNIKFISLDQNIGYGHGIMSGVKKASGEVIAWTHADLQTDPLDVVDAYKIFEQYIDNEKSILKGKRIGRNLFDAFFTNGMAILSSFFMGVKLDDINAQPKMFHREFLNKMQYPPEDFSLDLYFLYQAKINEYNIIEFPVHFGKRLYGESKGGGSLIGKWKLIKRTWNYMIKLKNNIGD